MNATQFIQQHGVDKAREVVSKHAECYMPEVFKYWSEQLHDYVLAPKYASFLVSDLKRLVESVDLVEFEGGLDKAKNVLFLKRALGLTPHADRLEQAIADYEQLFGNTETLELETLRDCDTSQNCKKFDERVKP